MIKLDTPRFTAKDPRGQLAEMHGYLYRITEQLNLALTQVEDKSAKTAEAVTGISKDGNLTQEQSQNTFNSIKALIIKSADIVSSYSEAIIRELSGIYVAQSDFGTYQEETNARIEENSKGVESMYENIQTIISQLEGVEDSIIAVNACIRSGLLYYDDEGIPVYGLEIGQRTQIDGEEVFNKYARFVSDRLSFFDQNGEEVAYISDLRLVIRQAKILSVLEMGGFRKTVLTDGSILTKWIGSEG